MRRSFELSELYVGIHNKFGGPIQFLLFIICHSIMVLALNDASEVPVEGSR